MAIIRSNYPLLEPRVMKTMRALQEKDVSVVLIGWDRQMTELRAYGQRAGVDCRLHIFRLKTPVGSPLISIILPFWWCYVVAVALLKCGSILHACDLDALVPSLFVKIVTRRKVVYDIFDFYSDRLPEESLTRRVLGFLEKFSARFADMVILADEKRVQQVRGLKTKKAITIYNSPPSISFPKKLTEISDNCYTLFYCGLLDFRRGILSACEAVEGLPSVRLILAGYTGPHYERLLSLVKKYNNTTFIGALSYDQVLDFTKRSDALLALYDPLVPNYRYASPNKLFEAMMCGKPIIVTADTLMAERVLRHACGIVVKHDDVESVREAIQCLNNEPAFSELLGKNGRKAYLRFYNWSAMKKRLIRNYSQMIAD